MSSTLTLAMPQRSQQTLAASRMRASAGLATDETIRQIRLTVKVLLGTVLRGRGFARAALNAPSLRLLAGARDAAGSYCSVSEGFRDTPRPGNPPSPTVGGFPGHPRPGNPPSAYI